MTVTLDRVLEIDALNNQWLAVTYEMSKEDDA